MPNGFPTQTSYVYNQVAQPHVMFPRYSYMASRSVSCQGSSCLAVLRLRHDLTSPIMPCRAWHDSPFDLLVPMGHNPL